MKNIPDDEYVACLCEGTAEEEIIKWLLEEDCLIFRKEQMIEEKPLRVRSAKKFQKMYLDVEYGDKKIRVIRILDSKKERFKLDKLYSKKVSCVENIITAPEIEILYIIKANKYQDYTNKYKNRLKPSEYCEIELGMRRIKLKGSVREYFGNIDTLVECIKEYGRLSADKTSNNLYDLLKKQKS